MKTDNAQAHIDRGKVLRDGGDLPGAIREFTKARNIAHDTRDAVKEARCYGFIGSTNTLLFRYGAALESLDEASRLGEKAKDLLTIGSINGNIATLYGQLGDFVAAEAKSRYAIECLKKVDKPDDFAKRCLSRAYLIHASACFQLKRNLQGYRDYDGAVQIAKTLPDAALEAFIWDKRGIELLLVDHNVKEAGAAFRNAVAITNNNPKDLDGLAFEKEHLAELELEKPQPDYRAALQLIDYAYKVPSPAFKTSPQYYPLDIRGRILLASGDKSTALSEFMKAVELADQWRASALPGDATNTQTVKQLDSVYSDYAQTAADIALGKNDNGLAINALDVLARNRAASLREQLKAAFGNNGKLPDEYFAKLAELQSAQAAVTLGADTSKDKAKLMEIRLEVADLENKFGLKSENMRNTGERIQRRNSLRDIQRTLGRDQVLISITLGKRRSYMWSVTADRVKLGALAGEEELTSEAGLFANAVRAGRNASAFSDKLSRSLFGGLPAEIWNLSEWMLVADGPLLNGIPFSALPNLHGKPLIEDKTIRFLPSELLLTDRQLPPASKIFVGVGDPIYNQADSRAAHTTPSDAKTISDGVTLARLVGSRREIESAAKQTHPSEAILLSGTGATRDRLAAVFSPTPEILHFAVHVVSPADEPQEAALALSLKNGIPELLTPETIASFRVPGSLVVLSGCSSGQGKVLPGAGLVGLSRAWLLAGASAVVVSNWPTPDDSGKFFSSFYDHFGQITSGDTAQRASLALRRTQLDMLRGSGYQTSPSFWGAFAVIAKE